MKPALEPQLSKQLRVFRDRLLEVNYRNPSVRMSKIPKRTAFDLTTLGDVAAEGIYGQVFGGKAGTLVPAAGDGPVTTAKRTALRNVARAVDARLEETGLGDLYVGMCWLQGHLDPKLYVRAPLFLVPARIETKKTGKDAGIRLGFPEPELVVNVALKAAILQRRSIKFTDELQEAANGLLDQLPGSDDRPVGQWLYEELTKLVRAAGLQCDARAYANEPLHPVRVAELSNVPVSISSQLVLGIFPQSSSALYADLEEMSLRAEQGEVDQGCVDNLLEVPADPENEGAAPDTALDGLSANELHTAIPLDPSQLSILAKAQYAECLVMRGPPGTGKSQVIANLVANAMAKGQRVLVACQKRAALDVVHDRLQREGLGQGVALVHDARTDRAVLYQKLSRVLNAAAEGKLQKVSALGVGERVDDLVAKIRQITVPLAQTHHGLPLYELYARATPGFRAQLSLPKFLTELSHGDVSKHVQQLEELRHGFIRFSDPNFGLVQRADLSAFGIQHRREAEEALTRLVELCGQGKGLQLSQPTRVRPLLAAVTAFLQLRRAWYRWLLPKWWSSSKEVEQWTPFFGGSSVDQWRGLLDRGDCIRAQIDALGTLLSDQWRAEAVAQMGTPEALAERVSRALEALQRDLDVVQAYDFAIQGLDPSQREFLPECVGKLGPDGDWTEHVLQELYLHRIDQAESGAPALRGQPFAKYPELRSELLQALEQHRRATVRQMIATLNERAVTPTKDPNADGDRRQPQTIWTKLVHEFGKKRQLKPLRALLAQYEWPMRNMVPCWLTSPDVASEIFPLEREYFDLVIFDEASQLTLERSLPALYRAQRVFIAGDEQQMPPSNFFGSSGGADDGEDDEEEVDEDQLDAQQADSLLTQAKRIYGFERLSWHYRSRYQELINFSNYGFYDGLLNIAANIEREPSDPPFRWIEAHGVWEKNTNEVEVQLAVNELQYLLASSIEAPSVGIITFNRKQMDAILDEIDQRRARDPKFAKLYDRAEANENLDDRPFVKNIENVQGDERDHIIFSVGYGPNPEGKFHQRFGPIAQPGGENRLNVAVTRARLAVTVICSFDPAELADSTRAGTQRFKSYLRYAKAMAQRNMDGVAAVLTDLGAEAPAAGSDESDSCTLARHIRIGLEGAGYQVETRWGVGSYRLDLAVVDPNDLSRFCLGIECDGPSYHSGNSVRERDIARQQFLESRGWKMARVWSRDYWRDPESTLRKVLDELPGLGAAKYNMVG